jgi:tetraacyldisaccharide 4'-kinase
MPRRHPQPFWRTERNCWFVQLGKSQHRRLRRDLDIVLLDALEPFGLGRMFPRGLLREPIGGLRRAGLVVLSRADLVPESRRNEIRAEAERRAGSLRWVEASHAPVGLCLGRRGG